MVRRVHRAVKRPASTSRKRKSKEFLKTSKRKKSIVDELGSKIESKILADIFKYDESSAHESEDAEDSEGKIKGKTKKKVKVIAGTVMIGEIAETGRRIPLSLPICARDIPVESYDSISP
ncbi:hypothetical protein P3L10_025737 [Capsicum annuum]